MIFGKKIYKYNSHKVTLKSLIILTKVEKNENVSMLSMLRDWIELKIFSLTQKHILNYGSDPENFKFK